MVSAGGESGPKPGDILFGKYFVEGLLGEGGMGMVWLVRHLELERPAGPEDDRLGGRLRPAEPGAVPPRGPGDGELLEPPERRRRPRRPGRPTRPRSSRWSTSAARASTSSSQARRADAAGLDRPGPGAALRRAPGGPRPGDRPPRPQAVEPDAPRRPPAGQERLKVLDFGIAKILRGDDAEDDADDEPRPSRAASSARPAYASPEQIEGAGDRRPERPLHRRRDALRVPDRVAAVRRQPFQALRRPPELAPAAVLRSPIPRAAVPAEVERS